MPITTIITHADLEAINRTTYGTADAAYLDTLCGYVDTWLQSHLFSWAYSASATVTVVGTGCRYLELGRWCNFFTAITIDGTALNADELADVRTHGYMLHRLGGDVWTDGEEVAITGSWGWDASASVPADYKLMVQLAANSLWQAYTSQTVKTLSAGDYSITYADSVLSTNTTLQMLMDKYRLPAVY